MRIIVVNVSTSLEEAITTELGVPVVDGAGAEGTAPPAGQEQMGSSRGA